MQNKKQKQHQDQIDTSATTSSNNRSLHHPDLCSICMENVSVLDVDKYKIYTCCGKVIHTICANNLHRSGLKSKNSCPWCRAENVKTKGSKEDIRRLHVWTTKKKRWAQFMLGNRYREGTGVKKDAEKASILYKLAADHGHHSAQFNLGILYLDGKGVIQSDTLAFKYLKLSAEQGDPDAQFNIGCMYAEGQSIKQSFATAKVWFERAVAQGQRDAVAALVEVNKDLQTTTTSSTITDTTVDVASSSSSSIKRILRSTNNMEVTDELSMSTPRKALNGKTTGTKMQEQLVSLPVEQCVMPSMVHRKRSYEMMALAARKESRGESVELPKIIPTNATNNTSDVAKLQTDNDAKNKRIIDLEANDNSKNKRIVKLETDNASKDKRITDQDRRIAKLEEAFESFSVHQSLLGTSSSAMAIDVETKLTNDDTKRFSSDLIFNLPYGFARFWGLVLAVIVMIEMIFLYHFVFAKSHRVFNDEKKSMQAILSLSGIAGMPLDIFMCAVMIVISFRYQLGLQHIDVKPFINVYRRCIPISMFIGFVFLMSQGPWKSQCKSYPCYSSSNQTQNMCDSCIGSLCPQAWGNPSEVSLCRATPTEEYPSLCGHKYCHKSYLDLSMFGILHLDCEGGKQGNYPFFGFPLNEKEIGGEVGLSFDQAQKNCKAQNWIFPSIFGLGRIVFM